MLASLNRSSRFGTYWYHRKPRFWFQDDPRRPEGHREKPEVVRFEVAPGVTPSTAPPVRIFLGSEPFQARAERVFLWSVKQFRDPSRVYEIHLMKDLKGYDREGWKTGFTFLRFAIPGLAGYRGRAIYNDVDQIYLADPAELFDLDMNGKGMLAITATDDSVMLIDCEVMARHWRIEQVMQSGAQKKTFRNAVKDNGLWGQMPGVWNARDDEYDPSRSKCFHFTTLQTQPWRPFPEQLIYRSHPHGDVWFALERAADAARFNGFTRERSGSRFDAYLSHVGDGLAPWQGERDSEAIGKLVLATGARMLLDYSAPLPAGAAARATGVDVRNVDGAPFAEPVSGAYDGVVAIDSLSRVPEEDAPWALDELFAAASKFVYVSVVSDKSRMLNGATPLPAAWWELQMELAAQRAPGRSWTLAVTEGDKTRIFRRNAMP